MIEDIDWEKKSLKWYLNTCIKFLNTIIDYVQSDIGEFLISKQIYHYSRYIIAKVCIFFALLITITYYLINLKDLMDPFFLIIYLGFIFLLFSVDLITCFRFKYSMPQYRAKRKKLQFYQKLLTLNFNNDFFQENFKNSNEYELKMKKIFKKIDYYSNLYNPYSHYFLRFGFLFSWGIPIIAYILATYFRGDFKFTNEFLSFLLFLYGLFLISSLTYIISRFKFMDGIPTLETLEDCLVLLLDAFRLKIRIEEFPSEKDNRKKITTIMQKFNKRLRE